ncbi:MAG: 30S ribosomal protein S16 [Anaerolineales bacterium]|nr:30S ribosomal protein S16 [Anaerolineales bacterium]
MLKIRLRRQGKKKQATFRVVVADSRSPRDGRFVEAIGHYNPRTEPETVVIKEDRALYWLSQGAQPTSAVERMLEKMGAFEKLQQVHQGVPIEELMAPPEPEVEEPEAEAEVEAEAAVAVAEAIVEAAEEAELEEPEAIVEEEPAEEAEAEEPEAIVEEEPAEEAEAEEPEAIVEEEPAEEAEAEEPEAIVEEEPAEEAEAEEPDEGPVAGEMSLEELEISTRAVNVLTDAGLETAQDLLEKLDEGEGEGEFLSIPGAGDKTLEEVQEALAEQELLDSEEEA